MEKVRVAVVKGENPSEMVAKALKLIGYENLVFGKARGQCADKT